MRYQEPKIDLLRLMPRDIVTLSQGGGDEGGDNPNTGSWEDLNPDRWT